MDHDVELDYRALEIPSDTLGLHKLFSPALPPEHITADLVAVHGIGGDSFSTWTETGNKTQYLWLRDFLPQSKEFKDVRVLTFGYDARVFAMPGSPSTGRIFTFGESLLAQLNDVRTSVHEKQRPLIFVAHSLGGLVVKSALVYAQTRMFLFGDLFSATKGITFFGTPHQGADVAAWSVYLGKMSRVLGIRSTTVSGELQRWSTPLTELTTLFSEQIPDLLITTFFEKEPYHGVVVVPEASARLGQRNEVVMGLDANHRSICKFADIESSIYRAVQVRLEATMSKVKEDVGNALFLPSVPGDSRRVQAR